MTSVITATSVQLSHHHAANVVLGHRDEFGNEDVVVDCVANATTDDSDGKGQGRNCGDQILAMCVSIFRGKKNRKLTSGQMIVVMIEAGTTIPPIPSPARTRSPQS
jgi:hypothetical protein